jgi:hypothetical protein
MQVTGTREVVPWVLSFGGAVEVVEPRELRREGSRRSRARRSATRGGDVKKRVFKSRWGRYTRSAKASRNTANSSDLDPNGFRARLQRRDDFMGRFDAHHPRYHHVMVVRAHVRKGRLVVDEPTDLPDGAEVTLELVEDVLASELEPEERERLEASIETARAQAERGEGIDGAAFIARLRAGRG